MTRKQLTKQFEEVQKDCMEFKDLKLYDSDARCGKLVSLVKVNERGATTSLTTFMSYNEMSTYLAGYQTRANNIFESPIIMKSFRAFQIETVPATNTKPARIKIKDLRFSESIVISYGQGKATTANERAIEYLKSRNIDIVSHAWAENKNGWHLYTILLTDNFKDQII